MSDGFLKLNKKAAEYFIKHDHSCYILLTQIALRAKRTDKEINHLEVGQAMIGDFHNCGLTEKQYRNAKKRLEKKYKLAAFRGANKGTVATLLDTRAFDINIETEGRAEGRTRGGQGATNKKEEERIKKKKINTLVEYSESFLKFYKVYPKKINKQEAFDSWRALNPDDELVAKIIEAVKKQVEAGMLNAVELKYCQNAARWLNNHRWEEDIVTINKIAPKNAQYDYLVAQAKKVAQDGRPFPEGQDVTKGWDKDDE